MDPYHTLRFSAAARATERAQAETDEILVGPRRAIRNRRVEVAIFDAAHELLEEHGPTLAAATARQWAKDAAGTIADPGDAAIGGVSAAYFWARVATEIESGQIR